MVETYLNLFSFRLWKSQAKALKILKKPTQKHLTSVFCPGCPVFRQSVWLCLSDLLIQSVNLLHLPSLLLMKILKNTELR